MGFRWALATSSFFFKVKILVFVEYCMSFVKAHFFLGGVMVLTHPSSRSLSEISDHAE